MNGKENILKNNFWLLKKIWSYTPGYVLWMITEGTAWGINHAISVYYIKRLFESIEMHITFGDIAKIISYYAMYQVIFFAFHQWYWNIYNPIVREKLHIALFKELFEHAVSLDIDKYDNPEFYNDFIWSMNESYIHAIELMEDTGKLINRFVTSLAVISVLISVDVEMTLIIIVFAVVRIIITLIQNRYNYNCNRDMLVLKRKEDYLKRVFKLPDYAKELRVSRIAEILFEEHTEVRNGKIDIVNFYGKRMAALHFLYESSGKICEYVLIIIMLYKILVLKEIGINGFAVAINGCWKLSWSLNNLAERIMKYHEHGMFIQKMIEFMKCKPHIVGGTLEVDKFHSLEICNLKFSYGKGEKQVLDGINMKIQKGEKIAIVGFNGAGKTTLTKLMLRLYNPSEGEILYNGTNIKNYKIDEWRKHIAVTFQDYKIFACSVAENVAGGEIHEIENEKVKEALRKSMLEEKVNFLNKGMFTQLTKEFDCEATELSGGEQQKVAIARAFYKEAEIMILDEPSSALDPEAEYLLNESIRENTKDMTVVFISHRLSTTKNADRIYVFDCGKVIESGTHNELMLKKGKYYDLFNMQAASYRQDESNVLLRSTKEP